MRMIHGLVLLGYGMLLFTGCSPSPELDPATHEQYLRTVEPLLKQMQQRLDLMMDVARWKWNEKKPIEDPEREKNLILLMQQKGESRRINKEFIEEFFTAQIEAAKVIQQQAFTRWKQEKQQKFEKTTDLAVLRKKIDQINDRLLDSLMFVEPLRTRALFQKVLDEECKRWDPKGIPSEAVERATSPLQSRAE